VREDEIKKIETFEKEKYKRKGIKIRKN